MPLLPPAMQGLVQVKAGSQLMAGSKLPAIVSAVCSATCQYIPTVAIVNSVNIVLGPGAGTQTGFITALSPAAMSSMMSVKAGSQLMAGRDTKKLFDAVSFGVVNTLMTSAIMQGTVIGGGPGTGTGKIIGLVPDGLTSLILAQGAFRLIAGKDIIKVASSIAFGICIHIMTIGVVTITNIGVAAPPPAGPIPIPAAPGIGRIY